MRRAVIVLPTYNEEGNIKEIIQKIFKQTEKNTNWDIHVLVVDSRSKDKTATIVKKMLQENPKIHILETEKEGLGKAYLRGFSYALGKLNPYLVFEMDADLSHDPKDISSFLKKIEKGADFVYGTRYVKGGAIPQDWGFHRKIFSVLGNMVVRLGFMRFDITDWTNGYRAIKTWVVKASLRHINNYSGYVFQIAIMDWALKNGAKIEGLPVVFKERTYGKSKINSVEYITHILTYVFTHSSFIKFFIVGLIGFIIDFSASYALIEKIKWAVWLSTILSTETAIIVNFILNNYWSFSYKKIKGSKANFIFSFLKFNFVSLGSIVIQTVGISLLVLLFGRGLWYLYKVIIIAFIIIPYSYILYNKVVWKKK